MKIDSTINYIIEFLIGSQDRSLLDFVSYLPCADNSQGKVVIVQSSFFEDGIYGTEKSVPSIPLQVIDGVPLLFGEPVIERDGARVVLHADIIASTYFLMSRYEEMARPNVRDIHGRFPGKESLPYKAGFISSPVVEEYGKLLRKCLRMAGIHVDEPVPHFSHIYLTHDVDVPWINYSLMGAFKRICGEIYHHRRLVIYPLLNYLGYPEKDSRYTFQYLIEADNRIKNAESVYFIKSGGRIKPMDADPYISKRGFLRLKKLLNTAKATLGYHLSYEAGQDTSKISSELFLLRKKIDSDITYSRNHYLASREPSDFLTLIKNGITDDFTMGYADVAGFRLGTCRPVRWINPSTGHLTDLLLHPLTIMDCSLTASQYMGLDEINSQEYGDGLIEKTFQNGGELSLLWHNNSDSGDMNSIDWKNYLHFLNTVANRYS